MNTQNIKNKKLLEENTRRQKIIILVAILSIVFGVWTLIKFSIFLLHVSKDIDGVIKIIGLPMVIFNLLSSLFLSALLIIGGIGLFLMKSWGILVSLFGFSIDFIIRLIGVIRFFYFSHFIKKPIYELQKGHAVVVSMVPDYIIILLETAALLFLFKILTRKPQTVSCK